MHTLKRFTDINFPNDAADGYYMNKNKNLVESFIYIDPEWYEKLFNPNTFYILGPKGSGKTLYAAYMCAAVRKGTISKSHTIDVSDYGKLIAMKMSNHLNFTDYLTMWKVILLQKLLFSLDAKELSFWGRSKNFDIIKKTISNHFGYDVSDDSFNPITVIDSCGKQTEVTNYLNSELDVSSSTPFQSISLANKNGVEQKAGQVSNKSVEQVIPMYTDTWLRSINAFKNTLEKISFTHNHFLFIDGLDVRPTDIDAKEYSECISALVRAVYDINTKLLGNMERKDDHEFKIIALTRTDIFLNSNLVNVTSCINDNCVELDWTYSNENEFQYSKLYKMMNRILGWDGVTPSFPVDLYFGFEMPVRSKQPLKASMYIQRLSRLRPRDIVVLLRLIKAECVKRNLATPNPSVFNSAELNTKYSNYYTDQVKSEMMFNYSSFEIKSIFDLVKIIKYNQISEAEFKEAYDQYCIDNPAFVELFNTHRHLVNYLYSLDVIGWSETIWDSPRIHWHYREVNAIDESYRLPWEQFDHATRARLLIHKGASKHIVGTARK